MQHATSPALSFQWMVAGLLGDGVGAGARANGLEPVGVGIVGLGNISGTYLRNLTDEFADVVRIIGCTDLDSERCDGVAKEYGIRSYADLPALLADGRVELVLNLTTPQSHLEISRAALAAGKHVYSEKPIGIDFSTAQILLAEAESAGLLVGCAPDTFLGAGLQTCRRIVDAGTVGDPIAATVAMVCRGHESWHPSPAFFYQPGAGPLLDMGPYYLTALVCLMGPIQRVIGMEQTTFATRTITSEPLSGTVINVQVPTHITALLQFATGATATLLMTFDVWAAQLPHLEVYGTEGTLHGPDPNTFAGPVLIKRGRDASWEEVPVAERWHVDSRGLGLADLASAIRQGRPPRASGALATHVLEVMHGVHVSAETAAAYDMVTTCVRPDPLPKEPE
jgi:predicted dehydrogenase